MLSTMHPDCRDKAVVSSVTHAWRNDVNTCSRACMRTCVGACVYACKRPQLKCCKWNTFAGITIKHHTTLHAEDGAFNSDERRQSVSIPRVRRCARTHTHTNAYAGGQAHIGLGCLESCDVLILGLGTSTNRLVTVWRRFFKCLQSDVLQWMLTVEWG